MTDGVIKLAFQEADLSTGRYKLGAVVFKNKRILSSGCNQVRHKNNLHPKYLNWEGSICAEKMAILSAKRPLKGASILVVRKTPGGKVGLARPCKTCVEYLRYVGITNVYYTTNDGEIVYERI